MTLSFKDHYTCSPKMVFLFRKCKLKKNCAVPGRMLSMWAHPYFKDGTLCAWSCGSEPTHTVREKLTCCASWVWDHLYVFKRQNHFLTCHTLLVWLHPHYLETPLKKSMGMGRPMTYGKACSLCKKNHEKLDSHEVFHSSFNAMYGEDWW